jgi:hypothetical protein
MRFPGTSRFPHITTYLRQSHKFDTRLTIAEIVADLRFGLETERRIQSQSVVILGMRHQFETHRMSKLRDQKVHCGAGDALSSVDRVDSHVADVGAAVILETEGCTSYDPVAMLYEIERIRLDFLDCIFNLYTGLVDLRLCSRSSNAAAFSTLPVQK